MKTPETIQERLAFFIKTLQITQDQFAKSIGTSRTSLNLYCSNKQGSLRSMQNIFKAYPNLNPKWLLYGDGTMLLDQTEVKPRPKTKKEADQAKQKALYTSMIEDMGQTTAQEDLSILNVVPVAPSAPSGDNPAQSSTTDTIDYKQLYEQSVNQIHQLLVKIGEYRGKLELYQEYVKLIKSTK